MDPEYWSEELGVSAPGTTGSGGYQTCIYNQFYFPSFSGFSWWWSRGRICDLSMNMVNWIQWSHNIGMTHWGYQIHVRQGQGWCIFSLYHQFYFPFLCFFVVVVE